MVPADLVRHGSSRTDGGLPSRSTFPRLVSKQEQGHRLALFAGGLQTALPLVAIRIGRTFLRHRWCASGQSSCFEVSEIGRERSRCIVAHASFDGLQGLHVLVG